MPDFMTPAGSQRYRSDRHYATKALLACVMVFIVSALCSFFIVDSPSSTHPEPVTERARLPATPDAPATTGETASIQVRGTTIRVGATIDQVLNTLKPADVQHMDFTADPTHPEGVLVTRQYEIDNESFAVTMGRTHLLGPERIVRISTARPPNHGK